MLEVQYVFNVVLGEIRGQRKGKQSNHSQVQWEIEQVYTAKKDW